MPTSPALPQNVTNRYVQSLLRSGSNRHFTVNRVERLESRTPGGLLVGHYYRVLLGNDTVDSVPGEGVTPAAALHAALVLAGVTFR